jgi:hypothetical protein
MMDHAPVQIGRHQILVAFRESDDDADERRAAMNDDGGFIAAHTAPIKKCLRRPRERFLHVLRDGVILACHGHLSKAGIKSPWAPVALRPSRTVCDCSALRRKLASYSRVVQDLFGHEHVAHGDTPVELAKERRIGVLWQFVALSLSLLSSRPPAIVLACASSTSATDTARM